MGRKRSNSQHAKVHHELEGLEIKINELGEIITNYDINNINAFLNKNVKDKKLVERSETLKKLQKKRKKSNVKKKNR